MIATQRHEYILNRLSTHASVTTGEICEACNVSAVTARADLSLLEKRGLLKRTHGGAIRCGGLTVPAVSVRQKIHEEEKLAIAQYAASLVADDETILCGSGSTTLAFVKCLQDKRGVTVITNDFNIIEYIEQYLPNVEVMSTGGTLGRRYRHLYGPFVEQSLGKIYLDKVFMGADSFVPGIGFMAEFAKTAFTKMDFLKHARYKIILMDHHKVNSASSFVQFAAPKDIDLVIMDQDPEQMVVSCFEQENGPSHVVECCE